MSDFAPKLAKVAAKSAKVGRSRAKLAQSWAEVGTKMPPRRPKIGQKRRDPQRESAKEPPRIRQGAAKEPPGTTLSDPMPPGMPSNQIKDERTKHRHGPGKGTRDRTRDKGHGTRDDERI